MKNNKIEEAIKSSIHERYQCHLCLSDDCQYTKGRRTLCGAYDYEKGFAAGAEWQSKQSPWISVNDRLPGVGNDGCSDYVLVRHNDFLPQVAQYTTNEYTVKYTFKVGRKTYVNHWFLPNFNPLNEIVTHWMPVPPLPTSKTE